MAKRRKTARKAAAKKRVKRGSKRRGTRTAKLAGRKVKRPKARRGRKRKGLLAGALDAVVETTGLRRRMNRNSFEGQ
jgi:hypothetical protein